MKLYELPRETFFRLLKDTVVPPDAPSVEEGEVYFFHHLDGMYSYCINKDERIVHIAAWAEVEPVTPKEKDETHPSS